MTDGNRLTSYEQRARDLVLEVAKTKVGESILTSTLGHQALVLGRRVIRSNYERSMPRGRLMDWTVDTLGQEAIKRGAIQKPEELKQLMHLLGEQKPRNILEIGTGLGGTVFALCHIAPTDARIVSIGLPKSKFGDAYSPKGKAKIKTYAAESQKLSLVQADSHTRSAREMVLRQLEGEPLDFLFIDGEHTLAGVTQDFADYSSLVRQGGLIAVHDIVGNPLNPACDVHKFWETAKDQFAYQEIIDNSSSWGGIGIIEWG
jgi:predicted O-methyltransferase YrrM